LLLGQVNTRKHEGFRVLLLRKLGLIKRFGLIKQLSLEPPVVKLVKTLPTWIWKWRPTWLNFHPLSIQGKLLVNVNYKDRTKQIIFNKSSTSFYQNTKIGIMRFLRTFRPFALFTCLIQLYWLDQIIEVKGVILDHGDRITKTY